MNANDRLLKWLAIVLRIYGDLLILVGFFAILAGICYAFEELAWPMEMAFVAILLHAIFSVSFVGALRIRVKDLAPKEPEKVEYEG